MLLNTKLQTRDNYMLSSSMKERGQGCENIRRSSRGVILTKITTSCIFNTIIITIMDTILNSVNIN